LEPTSNSINPKQPNGLPISSSTPVRSTHPHTTTTTSEGYPIEEVRLIKQNGAMGLSIVGGGNVACHPFGIDNPGIFISKIVPNGAASVTNLRPEETIGIRINGGIEMKSANIYDSSDEGIFVVNLINGTLAQKDGRLQVGTRIMEVSTS